MNIEHAYFERTGEYSPFPGICLVDTFELAEAEQASLGFMTEENAQRVKRQKESPIFVIIGNPPYNAQQLDENDNNKNRKYPALDRRISATLRCRLGGTSLTKLSDPYIKAIRWATDRIGKEGIVLFRHQQQLCRPDSVRWCPPPSGGRLSMRSTSSIWAATCERTQSCRERRTTYSESRSV